MESHAACAPPSREPREHAPASWHARSRQQGPFSGPSRPRAQGAGLEGIHAPPRDARERLKRPPQEDAWAKQLIQARPTTHRAAAIARCRPGGPLPPRRSGRIG